MCRCDFSILDHSSLLQITKVQIHVHENRSMTVHEIIFWKFLVYILACSPTLDYSTRQQHDKNTLIKTHSKHLETFWKHLETFGTHLEHILEQTPCGGHTHTFKVHSRHRTCSLTRPHVLSTNWYILPGRVHHSIPRRTFAQPLRVLVYFGAKGSGPVRA